MSVFLKSIGCFILVHTITFLTASPLIIFSLDTENTHPIATNSIISFSIFVSFLVVICTIFYLSKEISPTHYNKTSLILMVSYGLISIAEYFVYHHIPNDVLYTLYPIDLFLTPNAMMHIFLVDRVGDNGFLANFFANHIFILHTIIPAVVLISIVFRKNKV